MKKSMKVFLLVIVTIFIYAGLYYVLIEKVSPEQYEDSFSTFITSIIFAFLAIPVGVIVSWFLGKKNWDKYKKNIVSFIIAAVWVDLFGWFSVLGMAIGLAITEKNTNTNIDNK
jgi:amino acid permease